MTPELVRKAIFEAYEQPFKWGQSDCVLSVIEAATVLGLLSGRGFLPPWRDKPEAIGVIRDGGGLHSTVQRFLGDDLGWRRVFDADRPGDIGILRLEQSETIMGMSDGLHWWGRTRTGAARYKCRAESWRAP